MKTHLLITSFLVLFGAIAVSAVSPDQAVLDRILEQYELDPLAYEVELLSNRLQSEDVDPSQLTIKALTEKEPLGLFTVLATIEDEDFASGHAAVAFYEDGPEVCHVDNIAVSVDPGGAAQQWVTRAPDPGPGNASFDEDLGVPLFP